MTRCEYPNGKTLPQISRFMDLVDSTRDDGAILFKDLKSPPFMKYWRNLCIVELGNVACESRVKLWGTALVDFYGREMTGKCLSALFPDDRFDSVLEMHWDALSKFDTVCSNGALDWQDMDYKKWHQVTVPLRRGDQVTETLSCIFFE